MTIQEYIKQEYINAREEFDQFKEQYTYEQLKLNNYINTSREIGLLLQYTDSTNYDEIKRIWKRVLHHLIRNCCIERVKPNLKIVDIPYGFVAHKELVQTQVVMQFLEDYLRGQTVRADCIWWIQAGQKMNIITLDK